MKIRKGEPDIPKSTKEVDESVEIGNENKDFVFPQESVQPLHGLLFLGSIQQEVEIAGHKFLVSTLTVGDILRILQLSSSYTGNVAQSEAVKLYTVAACVKKVDGETLFSGISSEQDADYIYQAAKTIEKWYPAILDEIYKAYTAIEKTAREVTESLKK